MSQALLRHTPYEEYVKSRVITCMGEGNVAYNYKELAECVGLKPTQHFKRRINELVRDGQLILIPAFTPRGGIENRFTTPTDETTQEIPF